MVWLSPNLPNAQVVPKIRRVTADKANKTLSVVAALVYVIFENYGSNVLRSWAAESL